MAGGTKCYAVTPGLTGGLVHEVVEWSPRHADSVAQALRKLTSSPPQVAHVRFHELAKVEQEFEHSRPA